MTMIREICLFLNLKIRVLLLSNFRDLNKQPEHKPCPISKYNIFFLRVRDLNIITH